MKQFCCIIGYVLYNLVGADLTSTVVIDCANFVVADSTGGCHDDVIKWKHFPRYWPFGRGIHRSPVNSPHKGQWRGALMFSLICTWKKPLSKQGWGCWFETPSCPSLGHYSAWPQIPALTTNFASWQFSLISGRVKTFTLNGTSTDCMPCSVNYNITYIYIYVCVYNGIYNVFYYVHFGEIHADVFSKTNIRMEILYRKFRV